MKLVNQFSPTRRASVVLCTALALLGACSGGSSSGPASVSSNPAPTRLTSSAPAAANSTDPASIEGERKGGDLRFGFLVGFTTMDPHRFTGAQHLTAMWSIYDGLTGIDDNNNIVPRAATSWTISDDGLTYVFTLRPKMTFHDGSPVDAAAVVTNLDRARSKEFASASSFGSVSSVLASSSTEITIKLSSPDATLLANLATSALLVSPKALQGNVDETPIGSGPFKVTSWKQGGTTLKLQRFDDYWEPGVPKLDTLTIEVIEDVQTRASAQLAGDLDLQLITPGTGFLIPSLTEGGLKVESRQQGLVWFLGLNTKVKPFNDIRVREAFNRSVDRKALAEALGFGFGEPALQYLPEDDPSAAEVDPALYSYDPKKSRKLLAEAGYPDGLEISLGTFGFFATVAEALSQQVEAGGWKVKIVTIEDEVRFAQSGNGQALLNVSSEMVDGLTALRGGFSQSSLLASLHADIPEITKSFDQAVAAKTEAEAKQFGKQVSAALATQYYFVPLFRPGLQSVASPKVSGYAIPLSSQSQFRSVSVTP